MPFHIGPMELGIILVIILIIFGVGRLPQVGGAIGKGLREFRKAQSGKDELEESKKAQIKGEEGTAEATEVQAGSKKKD